MCDCLYVCLNKLVKPTSLNHTSTYAWQVGSRYKGVQNMYSTLQRSGSAWYRQRVLSLPLYGTSGSLWCRCLFMFVSCIKRCFFTDLCQTRVGRRYDKTNVRWQGGRHSELLTLENHVDRTK